VGAVTASSGDTAGAGLAGAGAGLASAAGSSGGAALGASPGAGGTAGCGCAADGPTAPRQTTSPLASPSSPAHLRRTVTRATYTKSAAP
jgi:hypothetical protein